MTRGIKISLLIFILLFIIFDPVKFLQLPVKGDGTHLYVVGLTSIHFQEPRDCGWLGCHGPDIIFPFRFHRVWWSDPTSFEVMYYGDSTGEIVAKDRFSVFTAQPSVFVSSIILKRFPAGDSKTMQSKEEFVYDKKFTYINGFPIAGLDPNSLQLFGELFAKDKNGVYQLGSNIGKKIEFADVQSFQTYNNKAVFSGIPAEDKNFQYAYGAEGYYLIIKESAENAESLGCQYYKINNKIYYGFDEVIGADPATFQIISSEPSKYSQPSELGYTYFCNPNPQVADKNNRYERGKAVLN